jgi:CTP synthase (UTP-ammonia lyase)
VQEGTLLERCYQQPLIHERHRHRYEINTRLPRPAHVLRARALRHFSDALSIETTELADHPFYIGVQFHPNSRAARTARIRCSGVHRRVFENKGRITDSYLIKRINTENNGKFKGKKTLFHNRKRTASS